ncbi:MAG: hypothetical protein ACD_23C01300G0001, partial [uncultured bacterium]
MPTDLRFVAHATERHAHVFTPGRLGNRLPQRGLANARWPHQAKDGGLHLVHALLHCKVFKDAVLDLVETEMVFVQHRFGIAQIVLDLALLAPRQAGEHVDIAAHHRGFGRHGRHQLELLELGFRLLAGLCRHLGQLDLLFYLFNIGAFFPLAEFLLDRLDLFVEVEVALVLFHLALHAATNFLVDIQDVDFAIQLLEQILKPRLDIGKIQNHLLVFQLQRQVRGNGVHQTPGIINAGDGGKNLGRDLLVELDVLVKLLHHRTAKRLDLTGFVLFLVGLDGRHGGREVRFGVCNGRHQSTLLPFHKHLDGAIRQLQHLQDGGDAAHIEHVLDRGFILGSSLLGHKHDAAIGLHRQLQRLDALGPSHEKRDDHMRKHHHVTQWQQRQIDGGGWQGGMSGHGNPQSTLWN